MADTINHHHRYHKPKPPKCRVRTCTGKSRVAGARKRCRTASVVLVTVALMLVLGALTGCQNRWRLVDHAGTAMKDPQPLDLDHERSATTYAELAERLGAVPRTTHRYRVGACLKFLGNPYWQLVAQGLTDRATDLNITVDVRAAADVSDAGGQRQVLEAMLAHSYDAYIVAPQTDTNLSAVIDRIRATGAPVLVVNEAIADADYWVGPDQHDIGVLAGRYLESHLYAGAPVAVIEGLPQAYAARERTRGFHEVALAAGLNMVATVPCNWDAQQALEAAATILREHPDLRGLYCNNDTMAMGALQAIADAGKAGQILVVGTDGTSPAYAALQSGDLAATIDHHPYVTGRVALELAVRLLAGQSIPPVVYTPQELVTGETTAP